jgi:regulator of replication initiation timing
MTSLDEQQAAFVDELAKDFGVVYANSLQFKQDVVRLQAENARLHFALAETQKKLVTVTEDNAKLADQMRGKPIPTIDSMRKKRVTQGTTE